MSLYNIKFSRIAYKEMCGSQLGELVFRSWDSEKIQRVTLIKLDQIIGNIVIGTVHVVVCQINIKFLTLNSPSIL